MKVDIITLGALVTIRIAAMLLYPKARAIMFAQQAVFFNKCMHNGFTQEQCIFFQRGADAP